MSGDVISRNRAPKKDAPGRRASGRRVHSGRQSTRRASRARGGGATSRLAASGGQLALLSSADCAAIHATALTLLGETGLAEAPDQAKHLVQSAGGEIDGDGRLRFPERLVEAALAELPRTITLHGRRPGTDLHLGGDHVHVGTGGASPAIMDLETRRYRPAMLRDLYDAARLVDRLDHLHFFSRPLAIRDFEDPLQMDINTAWACLCGTAKHVMVSAASSESVDRIAALVYRLTGGEAEFRQSPFLSFNVNHVVPPMRFDADAVAVLLRAVECGVPVMVNTFGQLGASSPVTIAACVAQTMAETLAGMVLVWLVRPDARAVFGPRPMITDLRTGAMSGGSGEQAKLTAAAVQMARFYGLPNSTIAGATDSKMPDAQSGYEKGLTVTMALQAGAHFITQAGGAQASLMGTALESYVIDNDMLGSILSAHTAIEVSPAILDPAAMHRAIVGDGHFLGDSETLARMTTDFLYPQIGDRRSIDDWQDAGGPSVWDGATEMVRAILASPADPPIGPQLAQAISRDFGLVDLLADMPSS